MKCIKCDSSLSEENKCCDEGTCCNSCCNCADGYSDPECGCNE